MGKKKLGLCPCLGQTQQGLGWDWGSGLEVGTRASREFRLPENLDFHPGETGVVRPEAVVCLPCNALEVFCVPFVL